MHNKAVGLAELEIPDTLAADSEIPERANDGWLHLSNKIGHSLKTVSQQSKGYSAIVNVELRDIRKLSRFLYSNLNLSAHDKDTFT